MRAILAVLLLLPLLSDASPPPKPLSDAATKRLLRYVASYNTDAFLADTLVRPQLARILGDKREQLLRNLDVRSEAAYNSGVVYLEGIAPHRGGEEHGFVGIDIHSGAVYAALLTEGRVDVYGAGTDRDALPTALRDWIFATWAIVTLEWKIPPNVRLLEATLAR